jgi:hypothetical protein
LGPFITRFVDELATCSDVYGRVIPPPSSGETSLPTHRAESEAINHVLPKPRAFCTSQNSDEGLTDRALLSQLNYTACWLNPPECIVNSIQTVINNFVSGTMNICRTRIYLPVHKEGLGKFELKSFIAAQLCSWVKRARLLCIDNCYCYDPATSSPTAIRSYTILPHHLPNSMANSPELMATTRWPSSLKTRPSSMDNRMS